MISPTHVVCPRGEKNLFLLSFRLYECLRFAGSVRYTGTMYTDWMCSQRIFLLPLSLPAACLTRTIFV